MSFPKSCDTFVALPPATADGCVIFGKNSDRPGNEVQEVIFRPAAQYESGTKLQCTYIEIDQVRNTYSVILSKPGWMWGAEMGSNEKGVCIGNEAVWTKLNSQDDLTERLLGMDLLRLGLERGGNARESVDVITSLLEKHGQGGPCAEAGDWAYHNSFIICDSNEAWVLETAGQLWVAEKVTEGVRNISNQLTITTKYDLSSSNLIEKATELGFYKSEDGAFNFARVFDESSLQSQNSRFCNGRKLLKKYSENGMLSVCDMMKILRDDDSGINMGSGTCGSQVSLLPSNKAASSLMPSCHWFTATPCPDISLFKPFIFGPGSNVGNLTTSPEYGSEDPRMSKPRFASTVERRHALYKEHEKLVSMMVSDEAKAKKVVQNISDLETNCIGDIDEILKNFDESSYAKVATLFEHMCSIEINFYK
ncbi:Secernin-2 [Mactra antiquata]